MGTNFYFWNKEFEEEIKKLKEKYSFFDVDPDDFLIHIAKTSWDWKPLFQKNGYYSSVKEIKNFYNNNKDFIIIDEYCGEYTWEEFSERVLEFGKNGKSHIKEAQKK